MDIRIARTVPETAQPQRLDLFLGHALRFDGVSREKVKQAILAGGAAINGALCRSPRHTVRPGDAIHLRMAPPLSSVSPETGDVELLFHDAHLAVVNKPPYMTVHPCPSCPAGTLAHRLAAHFPELARLEGLRPGIAHRLDKDTSGLLAVALTEKDRLALAASFANRVVYKEYLALLAGVPAVPAGAITHPVGRDPASKVKMAVLPVARGGREARSEYRVLHADAFGRFSLAAVRIHTGRTHQVRVHMASMGHPVMGDKLYGKAPSGLKAGRQMLHAWKLRFPHPASGEELAFVCPPPPDFLEAALGAARAMQRVALTGLPGCGKSALAALLQARGIPVWSADSAVNCLYAPGGDVWHVLRSRYGDRFVPEDIAPVDRAALFNAMCGNPGFRRELEGLVHPYVRRDMELFWEQREKEGGNLLAVAEAPLFLEGRGRGRGVHTKAGARFQEEVVVGLHAPQSVRHERLRQKRGWAVSVIHAIDSWHLPEKEKMRACDMVVENSGALADLEQRAEELLRALGNLRQEQEAALEARLNACWE